MENVLCKVKVLASTALSFMKNKLTKDQREKLEAIHLSLVSFEMTVNNEVRTCSCIYGAELLVKEALDLDFGKTLGELSQQHGK